MDIKVVVMAQKASEMGEANIRNLQTSLSSHKKHHCL
jgi:hypothetical protein